MCVDMVYVLCSVLQQFLLPISLELSAFLVNIGSCATDRWKIRCLQILYLCQLNYAMHVNWMQVSHQFKFFSFNHCRKHCIFFHFHSNLIEGKKKPFAQKYRILKTQVPSWDVLLYEVYDFENWCRCVVCSVQFHSNFCRRGNLHQTNSVLLFRCKYAVSASWTQKDRYVFCCVCSSRSNFFGIQTVHILSLLQLIVGLLTSSFIGYRSAFNLLQLCFGRKHVCFFTFTVSSL